MFLVLFICPNANKLHEMFWICFVFENFNQGHKIVENAIEDADCVWWQDTGGEEDGDLASLVQRNVQEIILEEDAGV